MGKIIRMETIQNKRTIRKERLRKKWPFFFDNLFTALLIAYLFLPLTVGKNQVEFLNLPYLVEVA